MLDDRNVRAPANVPVELAWTYDDNATVGAVLGRSAGNPYVSPYAAPARAEDISGLPPAYVLAGDMDILRDRDRATPPAWPHRACRLSSTFTPSVPHVFDLFGHSTAMGRRAYADEIRACSRSASVGV
jgi:acetyl esterase/lipase